MSERESGQESKVTVSAGAANYSRTVRYTAALAYGAAHDYWSTQGDPRYGAGSAARTMWAAEVLHLMMNENMSQEAAELESYKRCDPGKPPAQFLEHARWVRDEEERRIEREAFLISDAQTIVEMWSMRKRRFSGGSVDREQLIEILDRSHEDKERRELLEWIPGSEDELRDVLRRHW